MVPQGPFSVKDPPPCLNPNPITLLKALNCQSDRDLGTRSYLIPQGSLEDGGGRGGGRVFQANQAKPNQAKPWLHSSQSATTTAISLQWGTAQLWKSVRIKSLNCENLENHRQDVHDIFPTLIMVCHVSAYHWIRQQSIDIINTLLNTKIPWSRWKWKKQNRNRR